MSIKKDSLDYQALEIKALKELKKIAYDIDSPDLGTMYDAVGRLASHSTYRSLLPKAMELLDANDQNVKQAAFTVAGKSVFGPYISELFNNLKILNPVEREQVLQGIHEMFSQTGGPESRQEQKRWIDALENLGKGHQPTVFALMRFLGEPGRRWVTGQIRENIDDISLGAVAPLRIFPEKTRKKLIKLLVDIASKKRRDILPYICGIVDQTTYIHLSAFLKGSKWQERVEIASAISGAGIKTTSGFVLELVGDSNWRVKQALLEKLNIRNSRFSAISKILSFLVKETHTRVRGQAERTLLLLGSIKCHDSTLKEQRKKLEKQYRTQLLKAAQANKDLDSEWLGIEIEKVDPMHEIMRKVSVEPKSIEVEDSPEPIGVSLSDLMSPPLSGEETIFGEKDKSTLLSALLGAQKKSIEESEEDIMDKPIELPLDPTIPPASKFLLLLQRMSETIGKDVPLNDLLTKAAEIGISEEEFENAMDELEKQGIIYRSSKGTVSYVDIEL
ncbi:MAG: hypothetical protein AM325_007240 [Candidatus Thorarchaeota archaeon SMTZ1-45]|nr:MAG: hypothetical protein AM325_08970 [Candidatus Thorarchaeota archaeon SMTZ1-45]